MSAGAALGADVARAIDVTHLETPCFVTDLGALEANLKILAEIQNRARCTILLALKGFAQWSTFPLVRRYLAGATASSVAEARLAREELGDVRGQLLGPAGVVDLRRRDALDPGVHVEDRADIRVLLVDHPVFDGIH